MFGSHGQRGDGGRGPENALGDGRQDQRPGRDHEDEDRNRRRHREGIRIGKSIKVTGPKTKDYSFDLTEMAAMKTEVSVGERVKVTFTKSDSGSKATTIVAYPNKI